TGTIDAHSSIFGGDFKGPTMGTPKREPEEVAMAEDSTQQQEEVAMAEDSTQQQEEAAAMLEVMIQSTHQLDEILQRMCAVEKEAATRPAAGYPRAQDITEEMHAADKQREAWSEADGDSDAEFEECWDASPVSTTVDEHIEFIKKTFKAAKDGNMAIASTKVDVQALQESVEATGGDPKVRFASSTRDTAFVFPSSRSKLAVDRLDNALTVAMPCPVAAALPAEPNVTYTQFLSRVRQELIACDHLVPVQRADAVAMLAVSLLEKQHGRLFAAICSLFPRMNSQSSQDQDIQWIQGNRVCQFNENDSKQGLMLSSCTRYTLFLPKAGYLITTVQASDLQAAVAIALRLHDPTQPRSDANAVAGTENGYQTPETPDTQTKDKEERFTATNFSPPIVQLPEILNVSLWGMHDEVPSSDEADPQPLQIQMRRDGSANRFTKLQIETVRVSKHSHLPISAN
ncbi:hypothetical protein BBJ28_00010545, partial [Nothophytophthora sp. Chile5]